MSAPLRILFGNFGLDYYNLTGATPEGAFPYQTPPYNYPKAETSNKLAVDYSIELSIANQIKKIEILSAKQVFIVEISN